MSSQHDIDQFVQKFVHELEEENAAVFVGAGLSIPAGFVSWKDLLRPIAQGLQLEIDRGIDLIAVAQFHVNEKSRADLDQQLMNAFTGDAKLTENHRTLARLPIKTFWTTNYDRTIENALVEAGKVVDVKYTVDHLRLTKPRRDAVIYKMHGDMENPTDAVLTKDDYEAYDTDREPFVTALKGALVSKTFLFVGFSFTDPNLDYIFSRVRLGLQKNPRTHYCVLRRVARGDFTNGADFDYEARKQILQIGDLKRFGLQTLLIGSYTELTQLLQNFEERFKQRTIFVSGSAHDYGSMSTADAEAYIKKLSKQIISSGHKIVSGFGLGVGSHVITGVLQHVYEEKHEKLMDQLMLRPFPQGTDGAIQWTTYRKDMIRYAGIAIFLFGNKKNGDGSSIFADGMREEFEIAKERGLKLIPVGATGYMAQELWREIDDNFERYYPEASESLKSAFKQLNQAESDKAVMQMLSLLKSN